MKMLLPAGWPRPKGYSNGIEAQGRMVFTGGIIGWDETETLVSEDFVAQFRQTLENIVAILKEANAGPEHLVRLTCYVTDKKEYLNSLKDLGAVWKEVIGHNYPTMALVQVVALVEDRAKIEIEATAVVA